MPSAAARTNPRPMSLLDEELRAAEFVAVDVETNGRAGEDCEITEVGAVLVGGGELHDELESLVRVERPLSRGIEIFTGITQPMVDAAPPAREALEPLARLLAGRALVAHSASFARRVPPEKRPDLSGLPDDPGVYVFRDERGRPLYVGKSVSVRSRARAHFCAPAGWTERAEVDDYMPTRSELGALVLENRLIKRWRPPGNVKLKRSDGYVYLRCRFDIPFPILEVAQEPAPGHAVNVGPVRGREAALELVEQLNSMFGLRHCGRRLPRRDHPSAYGQMGRCLSPCLRDLDPNLYRRRLDEALRPFVEGGGGDELLAQLESEMREASKARRYERAGVLLRR